MLRKKRNKFKTHCVKGHPLIGDNLMIQKGAGGGAERICRACKNANNKAWRARGKDDKGWDGGPQNG